MYPERPFDLGGMLAQLRRSVEVWTAEDLSTGLRQLSGLRAALDACEARLLARFDAVQGWKADGAVDAVGWLRDQTGTSAREAGGRVRTAEGLAGLAEVAGALADGMITHAHAATLARAVERTPEVAEAQGELLRRAVSQSADAFERTVHSWERRRAADGGAGAFERQHARRSVTVTPMIDDGMTFIQARLDPVAGAVVTSALDRIAEELWRGEAGEARIVDLHTRRADALVEMARRAETVDLKSGRRPEPSVVVLIDHQTLLGQLTESGVCELADGTTLAPATARRLACTGGLLPAVLDGKSRPLDLGVAQRYASAAQRMALVVRDRGCVFPGCDRPSEWCDAHHLDPFPIGPTDISNLALVCEKHHHTVHEGGWTLEPTVDGGWLARSPAGLERTRPPRLPEQARRPERQRSPDPPADPAYDEQPDRADSAGQLDLLAS